MFLFLKYIQPSWYYSLAHRMPTAVLLPPEALANLSEGMLIDPRGYRTKGAAQMDLAYQALQKGFIPSKDVPRTDLQDEMVVNPEDNYRFVQRYFGKLKTLYVLLIRLLTFHNPIIEITACARTWRQQKTHLYTTHANHDDYHSFDSVLLQQRPLVSIVIPTLNRYSYLRDVLSDLQQQTYTHFEVLVCDQSKPVDEVFYQGWNLDLTLLWQSEKALWLARNRCIQKARGEYILLFDDDSRVQSDWVAQHLRCLDYFNTSVSAGVTHTLAGHGLSPKETYFHLSDVFDTGNAMVRRDVFEHVGLFDRQFEKQRMGDGEFGLRTLLGGYQIVSNPFVKRIHLKVETGGLRELGSWDAIRSKNILAPRPVPSVLYFIRKYFGNKQAFFFILQNVPFSFIPYRFKKSKVLKFASLILIPFILPQMLLTTSRSWQKATETLRKGAIIPTLF